MWQLRQLARKLLQRIGGHRAKPKPAADARIVSFPKSGRTWVRTMLGRALQVHYRLSDPDIERKAFHLTALNDLDPRVPRIDVYHDDDPQWKQPSELESDKSRYADHRVILLVRDPRDVMISNYFEVKNRVVQYANDMRPWMAKRFGETIASRVKPYEGDLAQWIGEAWGSFETILTYYNIWARNREVPRALLLVRYEDLHADPDRELRRMLEFLGVEGVSDECITDATAYASFDHMREMEQKDALKHNALRPSDPTNPETFKTRQGKVGGFAEYLTPSQTAELEERIHRELAPFYGYARASETDVSPTSTSR